MDSFEMQPVRGGRRGSVGSEYYADRSNHYSESVHSEQDLIESVSPREPWVDDFPYAALGLDPPRPALLPAGRTRITAEEASFLFVDMNRSQEQRFREYHRLPPVRPISWRIVGQIFSLLFIITGLVMSVAAGLTIGKHLEGACTEYPPVLWGDPYGCTAPSPVPAYLWFLLALGLFLFCCSIILIFLLDKTVDEWKAWWIARRSPASHPASARSSITMV